MIQASECMRGVPRALLCGRGSHPNIVTVEESVDILGHDVLHVIFSRPNLMLLVVLYCCATGRQARHRPMPTSAPGCSQLHGPWRASPSHHYGRNGWSRSQPFAYSAARKKESRRLGYQPHAAVRTTQGTKHSPNKPTSMMLLQERRLPLLQGRQKGTCEVLASAAGCRFRISGDSDGRGEGLLCMKPVQVPASPFSMSSSERTKRGFHAFRRTCTHVGRTEDRTWCVFREGKGGRGRDGYLHRPCSAAVNFHDLAGCRNRAPCHHWQ
jgi:hypothetical protein